MRCWPTRRIWLRLAIGIGFVIGIALIGNAFMAWRTDQWLEAKIASIRAAGDPATIGDLAPRPVPDEENAAFHLKRLAPRLQEFSRVHSQFCRSSLGAAFEDQIHSGGRHTEEQIAAVRAILENYPDIAAGLAAAANCEKYASLADFSGDHRELLDGYITDVIKGIRGVMRFSQWQSEVLLSDGKREEAVANGIALLRLARLYDGEPLLVNYLVGVAMRGVAINQLYDALAPGAVNRELYAVMEKELAIHDRPDRFIKALKTDRAYSMSVAAEGGPDSVAGMTRPFYFRIVSWPLKRLYLDEVDYFEPQLRAIEKSWPKIELGPDDEAKDSEIGVLAKLMLPAYQAAYTAEARIVGSIRALRIFNALKQFRAANGREADGLLDLVLPPAATIDPCSGKSLLLRRSEDGWVVYSVMENGVDDGGDFRELKDYGVAPRKWRSKR
jgi:hypothetical protein